MSRNSNSSSTLGELVVYGGILIIMGFVALGVGCTDEKGARKALEAQGFTEVQTDGWAGPFVCGDDWNATDFVAKNAEGKTVTGTACSGLLFKNTTLRW
jgi:hypothetical protein